MMLFLSPDHFLLMHDITTILSKIKVSKSCRPDKLSTKILKVQLKYAVGI